MNVQNPIADMFVRIKNAQAMKKKLVSIPFSKVKLGIAQVLLKEGYILDIKLDSENYSMIVIYLKYYQGEPVINLLKPVSLSSCRIYKSAKNLPRVMGGLGTSIISTSIKGVVSGREAYKLGQGGEILGLIA